MANLKEMYQIFTECWLFYRKYSVIKKTDEIWFEITREVKRIGNGHTEPFARGLVLLTLEQLKKESGYESRLIRKEGKYE